MALKGSNNQNIGESAVSIDPVIYNQTSSIAITKDLTTILVDASGGAIDIDLILTNAYEGQVLTVIKVLGEEEVRVGYLGDFPFSIKSVGESITIQIKSLVAEAIDIIVLSKYSPPLKKIYRAFATQVGNALTVVVKENTIGSIIWSRVSAGVFSGILSGAFPAGGYFNPIADGGLDSNVAQGGSGLPYSIFRVDDNEVRILTSDNALFNTPIEIIVYNQ